MNQTMKKYRDQRRFGWTDDGHRMNLYINAYLNVEVREDKFLDYLAAGLESVALEMRSQAAKARISHLRCAAEVTELVEVPKEEAKDLTQQEREAAREA